MDINHKKLAQWSRELGDVLDKKKTANQAPQEVQDCLLLLTYHFAELVLSSGEPKEALAAIPKEWQEDVQAVAKMIHSYRIGSS